MVKHAIRVDGIGKQYRLGRRVERHATLGEAVQAAALGALRKLKGVGNRSRRVTARAQELFWAVKDVSFTVEPGEVIGIIGRNGAGKSTLLKLLSRITYPTEGEAFIRGRVGSLLEVGTGFHPELSGRENIFLNGAILGMSRAEIEACYDEIIAFAEIERFIDTPIKRYSSGMYLRLAFAVAAHLQPEILLVDEVLAVGDAAFQKKCLSKMRDIGGLGRTVVFVSHNMIAIQQLCSRVLLIDEGRLVADGPASPVVRRYLGSESDTCGERRWMTVHSAPGNEVVRLCAVSLRTSEGETVDCVRSDDGFQIVIELETLSGDTVFNVGVTFLNEDGLPLFSSHDIVDDEWHGEVRPRGRFTTVCTVPGNLLAPGMHHVTLQAKTLHSPSRVHFREYDALVFSVEDATAVRADVMRPFVGVVRPLLDWKNTHAPSQE
ncbi:MAG: ABC transporter ATP-binding protein [Myxococcota bacterium]